MTKAPILDLHGAGVVVTTTDDETIKVWEGGDKGSKHPVVTFEMKCPATSVYDIRKNQEVVFHPDFLALNKLILGLDYEEFVRAGREFGVGIGLTRLDGELGFDETSRRMSIPSITTNLSGFGCSMSDLIENPAAEGFWWRERWAIDEMLTLKTSLIPHFGCIAARLLVSATEPLIIKRLSPLLDWKNLGVEYSKSRQLAYPGAFYGESGEDGEYASSDYFSSGIGRMPPLSVPASLRLREMSYTNYKRDIVVANKIYLIGWPQHVPFAAPSTLTRGADIRDLLEALKSGACHWAPLSKKELKEVQACVEVAEPNKRAKQSDAGGSHTRKKKSVDGDVGDAGDDEEARPRKCQRLAKKASAAPAFTSPETINTDND
ncbi:glycogen synthase-domain-containing protein [Mycena floridula]|nr:glycogen synthase-domain-containing protein [Mycena floridula]